MGKKYGGHWLTEEQKKFASDNHRLALKFVGQLMKEKKIKPWEVEEVKSYIYFTLCICAEKYDPEFIGPNGRKAKFSTLAFKGFKGQFQDYKEYEKRWRGRFYLTDFLTTNDDGEKENYKDIGDFKDKNVNVKISELKSVFEHINLSVMEKQVFNLYIKDGFNFTEIGEMFCLTGEAIRQCFQSSIDKAKDYMKDKGLEIKDFIYS
jgi:predicted DNA-binding protein YlxM (UPF0122 family)